MKARNKAARKAGEEKPYPSYCLSNLGATIRNTKKRIAELEEAANRKPSEPVEGDGWSMEECPDDNRIRVFFDSKPPRETCKLMRQHGFKWAPSVGAWQRMLNGAGCYAARCIAQKLQEL
jgi:hypothetical protein